MKNKINIAELLKDCPKGMELDCTMFENVKFNCIKENTDFPITCFIENEYNPVSFSEYGGFTRHNKAKCVIFPKDKTTWEGFIPPCKFKAGDILVSAFGNPFILKEIRNNGICESYCGIRQNGEFMEERYSWTSAYNLRFATEEEKQKLFQAIKDNGYKWNAKTKTLEKLVEPNFKVGDIVQDKNEYKVRITKVNIEDECYSYESIIINGVGSISFNRQDDWELISNKFDISTLKPFESKVLVRDLCSRKWSPAIWGFYDENNSYYPYKILGAINYKYCIPYEGNKHLLGTTDDCDDYYETW